MSEVTEPRPLQRWQSKSNIGGSSIAHSNPGLELQSSLVLCPHIPQPYNTASFLALHPLWGCTGLPQEVKPQPSVSQPRGFCSTPGMRFGSVNPCAWAGHAGTPPGAGGQRQMGEHPHFRACRWLVGGLGCWWGSLCWGALGLAARRMHQCSHMHLLLNLAVSTRGLRSGTAGSL